MMHITTWNVNGLRSAIDKGIWDWIEQEAPDVLCLQEVRASPHQIHSAALEKINTTFPAVTWNPASRPGYSGVAIFSRHHPLEVRLGLDSPVFDDEGRVICFRFPEFLLFNIYFPNGGQNLARVPYKLDFYAHLLDYCNDLHAKGEQIILCGDFNTAHREIDLKNPKENERVTGFLPKERAMIDRYLEQGFVDIYRHLNPDRVQYTWWTYRFNARKRGIGWRIDYFLLSEELARQAVETTIHDDVMGSDHCPVSLVV